MVLEHTTYTLQASQPQPGLSVVHLHNQVLSIPLLYTASWEMSGTDTLNLYFLRSLIPLPGNSDLLYFYFRFIFLWDYIYILGGNSYIKAKTIHINNLASNIFFIPFLMHAICDYSFSRLWIKMGKITHHKFKIKSIKSYLQKSCANRWI